VNKEIKHRALVSYLGITALHENMGKVEMVVVAFAAVVAALLLPPPPFGGGAPAAAAATGPGAAATNCTSSCGNISVPYPFGIEPGCYHATWFNLTCDLSLQPPKLFLGDGTVQVLEISAPNATVRINSSRVEFARRGGGDGRAVNGTWGLGRLPQDGPYFLSEDTNMLLVERCDVQAVVLGGVNNSLVASCSSVCPPAYQDGNKFANLVGVAGGCIGIGCCQANIYIGYSFYSIQINKLDGSLFDPGPESTDYTCIVDRGYNYTNNINASLDEFMPTLNWIIAYNMTCPTNASAPECRSAYSSCLNTSDYALGPAKGYKCQCSHGYQGNPYIADGCQGIAIG